MQKGANRRQQAGQGEAPTSVTFWRRSQTRVTLVHGFPFGLNCINLCWDRFSSFLYEAARRRNLFGTKSLSIRFKGPPVSRAYATFSKFGWGADRLTVRVTSCSSNCGSLCLLGPAVYTPSNHVGSPFDILRGSRCLTLANCSCPRSHLWRTAAFHGSVGVPATANTFPACQQNNNNHCCLGRASKRFLEGSRRLLPRRVAQRSVSLMMAWSGSKPAERLSTALLVLAVSPAPRLRLSWSPCGLL
jgi:hypothetical protein